MVLWMAVRIHYRLGLLHSSKKDRQKKKTNSWTCIQNHSNDGTKTPKKSFRTPCKFLICTFFLSHPLDSSIRVQVPVIDFTHLHKHPRVQSLVCLSKRLSTGVNVNDEQKKGNL